MLRANTLLALSGLPVLTTGLKQQNILTTETFNNKFDKVLNIGAAISRDEEDKYFTLGGMLSKSWRLWADWVNLEKGGITVGVEKWGVKVVEIEDYSNSTFAEFAANNLIDPSGFAVDFMFGPYSSGLTGPVLDITEADSKLLFSAGSSKSTVWTTDVDYGFGMLYPSGGYYEDSLAVFQANGASTVAILCNDQPDGSTCPTSSSLTTAIDDLGMTLLYDIEIDSSAATYETDLYTSLETIATSATPVDVLILHDYSDLCIDGVSVLKDLDWTPNALYLVICNTDAAVVEEIGESIAYATTYDSWGSDGIYVSGISGYTPASFTELFETHYEVTPTYHAASAFSAGEILVGAIEMQAGVNSSLCADSVTLAALIANNGWSTILAAPDVTFSDTHQASGEWATLQFAEDGSTDSVTSGTVVYPMVSWDDRSTATDDASGGDDESSGETVNNYYEEDDNDDYAAALALTAVFCFLGGILVQAAIQYFLNSKKSTPLSATNNVEMSSTTSANQA